MSRREFTILLCLLTALVAFALPVQVAGSPILSASEAGYPPYCVVNEAQQADGFSVELLRAALKEMGHEVTFAVGPWDEVKQSLVDGKVQVLPLVGRTPEREALFDFTFPYLTMHGAIVVRDEETAIETLADLKGRQVAVMRGDNAEEFLRRGDFGAEIVTTATFRGALEGLAAGRHDAVVMQKLLFLQLADEHGLGNLRTTGPPLKEFTQSFCFAVRKGDHQLLQQLNEGLSIVFNNGVFAELYRKWITPIEKPRLGKSRIIVAGDHAYPPYEYLDENGQPAGYNVELTRAIARQMGVEVEIQLSPWQQVRQGLENGRIDLVQGMFYSPERDADFDFSPAHTLVSHVVVARASAPPLKTLAELVGKTVVVMAGDIMHDLASQQAGGAEIVTTGSQEQALRLLAEGRHDYALVARLPALYWIEKYGWDDLRVTETPVLAPQYCYAARSGNEELLALFSEGLATLRATGEYRVIHNRTLGLYEDPALQRLKYAAIASGLLFLLLAVTLFWVKLLKRSVRARTAQLESEMAERDDLLRRVNEREATISLLLNSTAEGIYGLDGDGVCTFFNRAAQELLGYREDEMVGRCVHDLTAHTNPDGSSRHRQTCRVREVIATGIPCSSDDDVLLKRNGDWLNVEYRVHPIVKDDQVTGAVVTFIDITEKKKLMEQRIRSGQLSAVGELAAGIAHEINNPITGVINYAQILLNRHAEDARERKILANIIKEGNRVATIVRNLLNFVHKDRDSMASLSLQQLIHEPLELLGQQLQRDGIFLDIDLDEELPEIFGNAQKLVQVLLNLISNARHALNDKYPGTDPNKILRISASRVENGGPERLQLTVWDQGSGIAMENLARVFNRFYTTKPAGVGTGLGLSICHDIIEEHGGMIHIESDAGLFTKVTLEFPLRNR